MLLEILNLYRNVLSDINLKSPVLLFCPFKVINQVLIRGKHEHFKNIFQNIHIKK